MLPFPSRYHTRMSILGATVGADASSEMSATSDSTGIVGADFDGVDMQFFKIDKGSPLEDLCRLNPDLSKVGWIIPSPNLRIPLSSVALDRRGGRVNNSG